MEGLGRRIRKERKALGLTLEQLAKLVNTSKATLQRIETDAKSPSVALLAGLSDILRKPIDDLIRGERKSFYRVNGKMHRVIVTENFRLATICPFGLISHDLVINFFKANAGSVVKPHQDKGYEWVYVIKGKCIFEYSGISHELKGGDVIYYDARKTHSVNILTSLESIDIFIRT